MQSVKELDVSMSTDYSFYLLILSSTRSLNNFVDCSKECQVTDWKKHKVECLKKFSDMTVSTADEGAKNTPVINLTRRICAKCEKVYPDKQLRVCAKCKYVGCKLMLVFYSLKCITHL